MSLSSCTSRPYLADSSSISFRRAARSMNSALGVLIAQNDVVEYGHGLHQHKVLMHHADTQLHRLAG